MRGSASFAEATGKSAGQWNQFIHYPIPVVSEKSKVTTGNQFTDQYSLKLMTSQCINATLFVENVDYLTMKTVY
jgi:hypothetical protein